jgi:hypothetical protein
MDPYKLDLLATIIYIHSIKTKGSVDDTLYTGI